MRETRRGHVTDQSDFESGRINYFDVLSRTFDKLPTDIMLPRGVGPVLRKIDVDFTSQLVRNDVVAIQHKFSQIKETSILLEAIIIHEGRQEVVCTAKEVLVMYDFLKRQKTSIPQSKPQLSSTNEHD